MTTCRSTLVASRKDTILRLRPRVDLVASTVEDQRDQIRQALEPAGTEVVLDLADVEQMDSLGITLVLGLFKTCREAGQSFAIEGARPDLMRVFQLFNLPKFFPIREA